MADKIEIYGNRLSPFVERVYLQVHFKGIGDKVVFPGVPGGDLKSKEYLAINPLGKMPALRQGDFKLFESAVIQEYLEDCFPENPLRPKDFQTRARVRLIIRILDIYYHAQTVKLMAEVDPATRNNEKVKAVRSEIRKAQDILEGLIEGPDYAVGGALSLADVTLYSSFFLGRHFTAHFGEDSFFEDRAKSRSWYQKFGDRDVLRESNQLREKELNAFIARMMNKGNS